MGLEVEEFGIDDGAEFLLHMASNRKRVSGEIEAARQVSTLLGGLPLALNQMAALINARNCSIEDFQAILGEALEELTHHALVRKNIEKDTFRIHRLVQSEYRVRMDDRQEQFDAATRLLLQKFPGERDNKYDDDEWILYEKYIPQVLALSKNYADSQSKANPLKANMDFVNLLVNAANGIHDNDTTNSVVGLLDTADLAYDNCSQEEQDRLTWAHLQSLKCMYHFCTSEFSSAHLTFSSLRTRMNRLDDAHSHVNTAKHILETSGIAARFSWLSSYCAYRAGDVAMKQGRVQDAM
ncbi:hypothetical protein K4K61_006265 [Colletotrichum sp. SAR11_59]|nr:hypothetical protein K4K61_006265 [Colletotrichum sp. SAR11_59]